MPADLIFRTGFKINEMNGQMEMDLRLVSPVSFSSQYCTARRINPTPILGGPH